MFNSKEKLRVGVLGATGIVGQRFLSLLMDHPLFEVTAVAASRNSAGKSYRDAVWARYGKAPILSQMYDVLPRYGKLKVRSAEDDVDVLKPQVDLAFSALAMEHDAIRALEEKYACSGIPVISNNSSHRWTPDVPVVIPEVNPHHLEIIKTQKSERGWETGLIAAKPNCSIQSFVPVIEALKAFTPQKIFVTTFQAVSGAGKTLDLWPEMMDSIMPFIAGEEEKTSSEPKKIWARIEAGKFVFPDTPEISANCVRVPVSDGHLVAVNVSFKNKPTRADVLHALRNFQNPLDELNLSSAPRPFILVTDEDNRPQTALDRDAGKGMAVTVGRIREDPVMNGWKFVALSHNTIRGAAGGAILLAELLVAKGHVKPRI
ncbi:MAG TPA: aspartate-semialdehyde dehydrogenase [Candidatus Paceibacterota bacterium]